MESKSHLPIFVYSTGYDMDLGPHVFPSVKFGQIYKKLKASSAFRDHTFIDPVPLTLAEARLVHSRWFIRDLIRLKQSRLLHRSELPLTRPIVDAFFLASGGSLTAARQALASGMGMNLSGGFHHAYGDHAEGFCYLNDVAIAIRSLQKEKKIKNALIIDLDVHQGNGTAKIFAKDSSVFTFSMHEENNYPIKEKGSLDIGLDTACRDEPYLEKLDAALEQIRQIFKPDIIFYLAGVDPFEKDRLGGLSITRKGMGDRDRRVRDFMPGIPKAIVLAGGYAINTEDTVDLHVQTCEIFAHIK